MDAKESEQIVGLYLKLGTYKAVQKEAKRSTTTIWKCLKGAGVCAGKGGNQTAQIKATDEQLLKDINAGLTRKQIAEKYALHPESLPRRFRKIGAWPKRKEQTAWNKGLSIGWHVVASQKERYEKLHAGYEYLGTCKRRVRFRCVKCGSVLERAESTVRQKRIVCECCKQRKQQQKQIQAERAKLVRFLYALKEEQTPKKCASCGEIFYSQYTNALYCSPKCRKQTGYRERCKKYGVLYDGAVTRLKVVRRDGNTCQICGKVCDENDKRWGTIGPDFPTLDHIKPLAKGGEHTWDNVQCACAMCNSAKRDLYTA